MEAATSRLPERFLAQCPLFVGIELSAFRSQARPGATSKRLRDRGFDGLTAVRIFTAQHLVPLRCKAIELPPVTHLIPKVE